VLFSTHILSDVELLADHVAIVMRGELRSEGPPSELVHQTVLGIEVTIRIAPDADISTLGDKARRAGDEATFVLPADADVDAWLGKARELGGKTVSVTPRHETLEDLFLRELASADASPEAREGRT
jgi:ABC-2 type transport system ATP-binding protein